MSTNDPSSRMTDEWVARALAQVPCYAFPADHVSAGSVRLPPARMSFVHVFVPQKAMEAGKPDKYVATCLLPYGANIEPLRMLANAVALEKWPTLGQPGGIPLGASFHTPFKDQADKAQWEGYVPGNVCLTASTERRPPVVDINGAPIVDTSKVYPGVWAVLTVRPFAFETRHPETKAVLKRGVSMGLQSMLLLADDNELGGGGGNPAEEFAGINVQGLAPSVDPAAMFSAAGGVAPSFVAPLGDPLAGYTGGAAPAPVRLPF